MTAILQQLCAHDVAPQPWKNGGGRTRELLTWPGPQDWWLRISVADIEQDGPFSPYPGVDRWFGVLEGAGVELTWPQAVRRLHAGHSLLHFDGASAPDCRLLDGTTRDLNVMHRRGLGRIVVQRAQAQSAPPEGFGHFALFNLEALDVQRTGRPALHAAPWSLTWGEGAGCWTEVPADGHAWWIGFDEHGAAA
ncbi:HutD/Ves family protein [Ideonella sp. BN130291]|uniref:HutD/Ves family protein n=1 Tax=Ideonella sp. BN130291 TaxID=3112940 RepID=UPI002E2531D3|nr:HutD family protein [Ideonella sp. BN130291]